MRWNVAWIVFTGVAVRARCAVSSEGAGQWRQPQWLGIFRRASLTVVIASAHVSCGDCPSEGARQMAAGPHPPGLFAWPDTPED
jgi:hypothetical protein